MSIRADVQELIVLAQQGKFLEAIEKFYAEDATMQENLNPPRVGLAALLENDAVCSPASQTSMSNRPSS